VASRLAQHFEVPLLNSGLFYRTVAYLYSAGIAGSYEEGARLLCDTRFQYRGSGVAGTPGIWWMDEEITSFLSSVDISQGASKCAALADVRQAVNSKLRTLLSHGGIAEGRDMGKVFAEASLKVFLSASPEVRAARRSSQRLMSVAKDCTSPTTVTSVLHELSERDHRDTTRSSDPLTIFPDALVIDSSLLSLDEVVNTIISEYHLRAR
jgi:CMP/dCMP kinase